MELNGKTKVYGVIGNPIEHTLSPTIHNTIAEHLNINMCYMPFFVPKDNLRDAIHGAYALNIQGLNVTVPYKEAVMEYLVDIDEDAKFIGAVNTLARVEGGYKGYNTDVLGLMESLKRNGVQLEGRIVVILGAGGAAKAASVAAVKLGARELYILNRTVEKATILAHNINHYYKKEIAFGLPLNGYQQLMERKESYIVIQAASVGLHSVEQQLLIEEEAFYQGIEAAVDIIYNPPVTAFMKRVRRITKNVHNGLDMLLYQGVRAFEIWNNTDVANSVIEAVKEKKQFQPQVPNNIVLVGFMGSGKSTVGRELATKLNYEFIDTDFLIESQEEASITHIFETAGEEVFRNLETAVTSQLKHYDHTVISTGGGIIMRAVNESNLRDSGYVIYLKISKDEILKRLENDKKRPLLQAADREVRVQQLLETRDPIYSRIANVTIDVDHRSVNDIVIEIIENIDKWKQESNKA